MQQLIMEMTQNMNNILHIDQSNGSIYNWIAQIQSVFSQYIHLRTQLTMLDDHLRVSSEQFDKLPTQQNFYTVQNIWHQKFNLMHNISDVVNHIVSNFTEATKIMLTTMESSIEIGNKLSLTLSDNAIGSIYSLIEENHSQLDIKELYRQSCLMQNIPMKLNNIEIKIQMMRISLPNFDNLKRLIRDY